jgi:cell division protein FtsQ
MSSIALFRNNRYNQKIRRRDRGNPVQEKREREAQEFRQIFKLLILVLAAMLALELIFHFYIARTLVIRQVTIEASDRIPYTNGEILRFSGLEEGTYFFEADTELIASKLEQLPIVKSAVVRKTFPHFLSISLSERAPVSTLMVVGEEGMQPVYVDCEGVIFRMDRRKPGGQGEVEIQDLESGGTARTDLRTDYLDLPVLSGIEIPAYQEGMSLPPVLTSFLSDLERLRREEPALYRLISEVKFVKKNHSQYEVVLYPSSYPVKVRIGSALSSELMKYIALVLDVMAREGVLMEIDELDFRTEEVVYRLGRE